MAIVWIGDFRCKSLQYIYESSKKATTEHSYIIDDLGGSDWFSSGAQYQLEKLCPVTSHIVVMSGFIDCVNSCIWKTIDIKTVAQNYKTALEKLKSNYNGHLFYFCSVPPVDGDYSNAFAKDGIVTAKELNTKIKTFNTKMKESCPVTFLDSYSYITKTSLATRDGIRYTNVTAKALQEYITCQVELNNITISNTYLSKLRITAADAPNPQDESFKYWTSTSAGGLNECIELIDGCVLPNCTGYAWGRFYEISGERPKLSNSHARDWYGETSDGYERGKVPKAGAVICWSGPSYEPNPEKRYGHVAIVEVVSEDKSSITISQSAYRDDGNGNDIPYDHTDSSHFWPETLTNEDGNWGWSSKGYTFQGFIYNPNATQITSGSTTTPSTPSTPSNPSEINAGLCTANSYTISREQMTPNAKYIWQYLGSRGWTVNAVAALLGNMEAESKMSPCVWETADEITTKQVTIKADGTHVINEAEIRKMEDYKNGDIGYGLTQWTPYSKYITWCNDGKLNGTGKVLPFWDINSQLQKILDEVVTHSSGESWNDYKDQWMYHEDFDEYFDADLSFKEFTVSTADVDWLALAFLCRYERPSLDNIENTIVKRKENARYWYNIIKGISPTEAATTRNMARNLTANNDIDNTYLLRTTVTDNTYNLRATTALSSTTLPVVGSEYLEEDQKKLYAQYIWQYFGSRGWTVNAVAALLGNMEAESTLNPHLWQHRIEGSIIGNDGKHTLNMSVLGDYTEKDRLGYGLTQWSHYTKYTDWCAKNNLNYWEIDSQLKRIEFEVENNRQWMLYYWDEDVTFKDFTQSTRSAYDLAFMFVSCYEIPGELFNNVEALKQKRGGNANKWFTFLNNLSPDILDSNASSGSTSTTSTKNTQLKLAAFKVDKKTDTQAQLSFVATNCTSCSYELKHDKSTIKTKKGTFKGGIKTFVLKDLIPNTKYSIKLEVQGANSTKESKELSFTTLQSYPASVKSLKLEPKLTKNFKDADNEFILTVTKPDSLGYWKSNSHGYELYLYINGIHIKTKTTSAIKNLYISDFNIKQVFGYTCKTGDTVQVGIRTWVKTNSGTTIYDSSAPKVSKAFCLLNKPVMAYLNLKS